MRDGQLTGMSVKIPLPAVTLPSPEARSPFQVTVAVRTAAMAIGPPSILGPLQPSLDGPMSDGQPPSLHPVPILRGELVYLRPAERSDLELFVRWLSDAEVASHLAVRSPISQAMEDK